MSRRLAYPRRVLAVTASLLTSLSAFAGDAIGIDAGTNQAKNLARLNCGAHIDRILPGGKIVTFAGGADNSSDPSTLLLDDTTLSCPLSLGDNVFVVTLPHASVLQRFAFINRNAAAQGDFEVAVSNYRLGSTDPAWTSVQRTTPFDKERLINLPMLGVEARYVRLTFHVRKEGQLAALALYGIPTLESFARVHTVQAHTNYSLGTLTLVTHLADTLNFNYANQYAFGRVVYVSSSGEASPSRMIDDDAATFFSFAPNDPNPTVIVALANRQKLHRVSALSGISDARVEVYLLDEVGDNPGDLSHARLVGTATTASDEDTLAINFEPQMARYVALRWFPKHLHQGPPVIAEVCAFGSVPLSVVDLGEQPDLFADASKPGESAQDFSNSLGTLASPPTVQSVSP
jgi:hypothetical protein